MPHRTFFWFIVPSLAAMILFIAMPIVSVVVQSLHIEHEQVLVVSENCGPFGCKESTSIDWEATERLREEAPMGRFNGFGTYLNRGHLAVDEVSEAWRTSESLSGFLQLIYNLPLYKALAFTLTYTFVVTPLVLVVGMAIALGGEFASANCQGANHLRVAAAHDCDTVDRFAHTVLDDRCRGHHRQEPAVAS